MLGVCFLSSSAKRNHVASGHARLSGRNAAHVEHDGAEASSLQKEICDSDRLINSQQQSVA